MDAEIQSPEVLAAALQPILYMIEESSSEEYQDIILPFIRNVFLMPKSVQVNECARYAVGIKQLISKEKSCTFFRSKRKN